MNYTKNDRKNKEQAPDNILYGRNSVMELLKSDGQVDKLFVQAGQREGSITTIVALALKKKIPTIEVNKSKLDELCARGVHQGVAAVCSCVSYVGVEDILARAAEKGEKPFIVIADGIEDPGNLGAVIRNCECAGVHGLIIPKRRCSQVTPVTLKSAAGACSYLPIARVPNLASTIDSLKESGLWIFGAEAGGDDVFDADFDCGAVIVLGGEDGGVSHLIKSKCDHIVSIPMYGKINSLNVSAAGAVVLNVAAHQRRAKNG